MANIYETGETRQSIGEILVLALAGGLGVLSALVADWLQKGDASAVFAIERFLFSNLDVAVPHYLIAIGLLVVGSASVFVYEPTTRRAAFTTGASILAVVMTLIPVSTPPTIAQDQVPAVLPSAPAVNPAPTPGLPVTPSSVEPAILGGDPARAMPGLLVQTRMEMAVQIVLQIPGADLARLPAIEGRIHNKITGETWMLGAATSAVQSGTTAILTYNLRVPMAGERAGVLAHLICRFEVPGYRIASTEWEIRDPSAVSVRTVVLQADATPLPIQRLFTPRKF